MALNLPQFLLILWTVVSLLAPSLGRTQQDLKFSTQCSQWNSVDSVGSTAAVMLRVEAFIDLYQKSSQDQGCLANATREIQAILFKNPGSILYNEVLNKIALSHKLARTQNILHRQNAIESLMTVLQHRWVVLNLDSLMRMESKLASDLLLWGGGGVVALTGTSFLAQSPLLKELSKNTLTRYVRLFGYIGRVIPVLSQLQIQFGDDVARVLSQVTLTSASHQAKEIHRTVTPEAAAATHPVSAYYASPYEILSLTYDGVTSSYTDQQLWQDIASMGTSLGVGMAVSISIEKGLVSLFEGAIGWLRIAGQVAKPSIVGLLGGTLAASWSAEKAQSLVDSHYKEKLSVRRDLALADLLRKNSSDFEAYQKQLLFASAQIEYSAVLHEKTSRAFANEIQRYRNRLICNALTLQDARHPQLTGWSRIPIQNPRFFPFEPRMSKVFRANMNSAAKDFIAEIQSSRASLLDAKKAIGDLKGSAAEEVIWELDLALQTNSELLNPDSTSSQVIQNVQAALKALARDRPIWQSLDQIKSLAKTYCP